MKSLLFIVVMFSMLATRSQDCRGYYFMQDNKTIEMTIYNKKGDPSAKQVYKVSNVKNSGSSTTADLNTELFDAKGKSIAKGVSAMKCDGGVMMIDMKLSMPQTTQVKDASVKADNIYIEYPSSMKVGDNLKDATMEMNMETKGIKQSINMDVKNRKVEAKEKVTTSAGTWDCYKISYKTKMQIKTMGIGVPMDIEGAEWFAPGFGIVKTETGQGSTAITSIK